MRLINTLFEAETPSLIVSVQFCGPTDVSVNGPAPLAGVTVNAVVGQAVVEPVIVSAAAKLPVKYGSLTVTATDWPAAVKALMVPGDVLLTDA